MQTRLIQELAKQELAKQESVVRIYRPLRVPAADLAKQDAAAKKAKLSWNEWVLRKLQSFFIALALVVVGCGARDGVCTDAGCPKAPTPQAGEGSAGGASDSVGGAGAGGEAGVPETGKLFEACGEPSCPWMVGDPGPKLICSQGICTFDCLVTPDAAQALCASYGRQCQGDESGVVSCQ